MKITASDRKISHHDRGPCFLRLPFFLLHTHFSSAAKEKLVVITVFLSKLDHRTLFNYIYYETTQVGGLVSI